MCACVCVRACVSVYVRACVVHACVRACVSVCVPSRQVAVCGPNGTKFGTHMPIHLERVVGQIEISPV